MRSVGERQQADPRPTRSRPYPGYLLPIAGEQEAAYDQFAELRAELLIDYGFNTARAYWGDLDDVYRWAVERGKDVLALTDTDIRRYIALLRRRKYSESTIRRRVTCFRAFFAVVVASGLRADNPAAAIVIASKKRRQEQGSQ